CPDSSRLPRHLDPRLPLLLHPRLLSPACNHSDRERDRYRDTDRGEHRVGIGHAIASFTLFRSFRPSTPMKWVPWLVRYSCVCSRASSTAPRATIMSATISVSFHSAPSSSVGPIGGPQFRDERAELAPGDLGLRRGFGPGQRPLLHAGDRGLERTSSGEAGARRLLPQPRRSGVVVELIPRRRRGGDRCLPVLSARGRRLRAGSPFPLVVPRLGDLRGLDLLAPVFLRL